MADLHGATVYLLDGADRAAPTLARPHLAPGGADDSLVVVPTYNEAGNISTLLAALAQHAPEADVLVVDDGSPDGTADLVRADDRYGAQVHLLNGR